MKAVTVSLLLSAAILAPGAFAQGTPPPAQSAATACPPSTTLEELTKALDDAVSGPAGKDRTCLRGLMLPDARLTPIRKTDDGVFEPRMLTVEDWINAVAVRGGEFYERQVKVQSESYGHFAHLWSTYEIRPTPDGKASVMGINSVQAVNDGKRWRVLSVLWEPDSTAGPIPPKYLP
ncbi:MAG TPA: hypothetical protein VMD29_16920 [Terracidiphilus sp.]|nr:hypothetical protein [Terracidiphilus sp.]